MTAFNSISLPHERAWREQAEALADWTLSRAVNRDDVWGGYVRPDRRQPGGGNSYTAPAVKDRGRRRLTRALLVQHYRARHGGDVLGTHSTSRENTSL
jgi:hypothetical protein